jgi:hypothetical protein
MCLKICSYGNQKECVSRIGDYKWKENLKVEFVENLKRNEIQLCMGGIESALHESTIDRTLNFLYLAIKNAGYKTKFSGRKYNKAEQRFDEERKLRKKETTEHRVKDDDVSRFKYWECRKEYYNILGEKKKTKIMARKAIRFFK